MVAWTAIGIFYYRLHDLILATTGAEDGPERIGRLGNAWLGDMMVMSASVTEVPVDRGRHKDQLMGCLPSQPGPS